MVVCVSIAAGCGDDDDGKQTTNPRDGSADGGEDAAMTTKPPPKKNDAGNTQKPDAGKASDAGMDSAIDNPFEYDAAGDYVDAKTPHELAGPPPDGWTCPAALWADGVCDCGCSVRDYDCVQVSCTEPGCMLDSCGACFTAAGAWQSCVPEPTYDPADWTCDSTEMNDGVCDCGCGIPDPACHGEGCTTPGCRVDACIIRHGCDGNTDPADTCAQSLPSQWRCAWDSYGSGDGCDCGCGMSDPDCGGQGCADALCASAACTQCHDKDGRPYACEAAEAGWGLQANDGEYCSAIHYGTNDGCDCGCGVGAPDPDCGNEGCDAPGCFDAACTRCTVEPGGKQTGCMPPSAAAAWETAGCSSDDYGTGDGCDCGCGAPDPDCSGGSGGSVDDNFTADCDVCHGTGAGSVNGYMRCPGWTCTDDAAWDNAECDCGCGVVDPFCRLDGRFSCAEPGCETPVCQYCNDDGGNRTACGGSWTAAVPSTCNKSYYGLDGLCDCGCASIDPDCGAGEGCADVGCVAEGCEVCHDRIGGGMHACTSWTCDVAGYGTNDGCDCGCGSDDPDCAGAGCTGPGCQNDSCTTCHDPYGRAVPCP